MSAVEATILQQLVDLPLNARVELLAEVNARLQTSRLEDYRPYPKQLEFHAHGINKRERLLRAGNQEGKTFSAGHEVAMHATGLYPDDWPGRRFITEAPVIWAGSDTGETTRDNVQRQLIGITQEEWGTGCIPKKYLGDYGKARGVDDLLDWIHVFHTPTQSWTFLKFKYYAQGRQKWQGMPCHLIWADEEPPIDIYTEALARITARSGMIMLTCTPLLGMSEVMRRFMMEESNERSDTNMTIDDAEHIPVEERAKIVAGYPPHEREARAKGIPMLGSGRIYPVPEEVFSIESRKIPSDWLELCAMDFGPWDHPTAAVRGAYDPENDCAYITNTYRRSECIIPVHAQSLLTWGKQLPWAWPADMNKVNPDNGIQYAVQYRNLGLNMLGDFAQWPETRVKHENLSSKVAVEPGLSEILERLETGRLKVFSHLNDWFEEFRLYHREDGKVVKEFDDLMDATRYFIMMLRYAKRIGQGKGKLRMPPRRGKLL